MKRKFNKPALSNSQLISHWRQRRLKIVDQSLALDSLNYIGYYRLSGYAEYFYADRKAKSPSFIPATNLEQILDLYHFDRQFRLLLLDPIERIEVAIRNVISNHMSTTYHDPHWFMNSNCMRKQIHAGKSSARRKIVITTLDQLLELVAIDTQYAQHGGSSLIFRKYNLNYQQVGC